MTNEWGIALGLVVVLVLGLKYKESEGPEAPSMPYLLGSVLLLVAGAYVANAGFLLLDGWGSPVDFSSETAIRVAKTSRGRGTVFLLAYQYWPHFLVTVGLLGVFVGTLKQRSMPLGVPSWFRRMSGIAVTGTFFVLAKTAVEQFQKPTQLSELKEGFLEVTDNADALTNRLGQGSLEQVIAGGAYAVARFLPDSELIPLYAERSKLFKKLASMPELHFVCQGDAPKREMASRLSSLMPIGMVRYVGRAYGYQELNKEEWHPSINLNGDPAVWVNARETLERLGADDAVSVLFEGASDGPTACNGTSELYGLASSNPWEPVGIYKLLDFTRTIDRFVSESALRDTPSQGQQ